ncbi:hypothetical protein CDAR_379511 [Caerostris darwini]|uniref:Uncharacterized protein n=1 Tax=Caerostris darwini TaxID=1538125 RepID=A0AAV4VA29_9ARAC|nr:hypothetical protein CDAR_379511 [Caerostris darwini]
MGGPKIGHPQKSPTHGRTSRGENWRKIIISTTDAADGLLRKDFQLTRKSLPQIYLLALTKSVYCYRQQHGSIFFYKTQLIYLLNHQLIRQMLHLLFGLANARSLSPDGTDAMPGFINTVPVWLFFRNVNQRRFQLSPLPMGVG